jgi:predicted RNA-binding protein associated with RNAse of E/G family
MKESLYRKALFCMMEDVGMEDVGMEDVGIEPGSFAEASIDDLEDALDKESITPEEWDWDLQNVIKQIQEGREPDMQEWW